MELQIWVCQGRRILSNGKIGVQFQQVVDGCLSREPFVFDYGACRGTYPGGMYEVESLPDHSSARVRGRKFKDEWPFPEDIQKWDMEDQEVTVSVRLRKLEREGKGRDAFKEIMAPIIRQYQRTDYTGRRAIEAIVLSCLKG